MNIYNSQLETGINNIFRRNYNLHFTLSDSDDSSNYNSNNNSFSTFMLYSKNHQKTPQEIKFALQESCSFDCRATENTHLLSNTWHNKW
jgi:hypothetical protein